MGVIARFSILMNIIVPSICRIICFILFTERWSNFLLFYRIYIIEIVSIILFPGNFFFIPVWGNDNGLLESSTKIMAYAKEYDKNTSNYNKSEWNILCVGLRTTWDIWIMGKLFLENMLNSINEREYYTIFLYIVL